MTKKNKTKNFNSFKKAVEKTRMIIAGINVLAVILMVAGVNLGLFMYFSTWLPGNPWRKLFYIVALAMIAIAAILFDLAIKAKTELMKALYERGRR